MSYSHNAVLFLFFCWFFLAYSNILTTFYFFGKTKNSSTHCVLLPFSVFIIKLVKNLMTVPSVSAFGSTPTYWPPGLLDKNIVGSKHLSKNIINDTF